METTWIIIGTLGMWLIECSYLPQVFRLWRRKEATDISAFFPAMNLTGRLLATAYSAHLGSTVLALGFLFGVFVRATFLWQVIYYRWLANTLRQRRTAAAVTTIGPVK